MNWKDALDYEGMDPSPISPAAPKAPLGLPGEDHECTKTCPACRELKDGWAFAQDSRQPDHLGRICRHCRAVRSRAWYLQNRETILAGQRARRRARKQAAEEAKQRFLDALPPDACPLLGGKWRARVP